MQKINFIVLFTTLFQIKIAKLTEYLKNEKIYKIGLKAKINARVILGKHFYFKEKIMFKSHLIDSDHRALSKKVDAYLAPDYSTTVCNSSMSTRSL